MKKNQTDSIVRSVLALGRRLRAERPSGSVSLSSIGLLSILRQHGPMPAARLAAEGGLQPQSITRLVSELEKQGWIARARSEVDRRELLIDLTGDGLKVLIDDLRARSLWLEKAMAQALNQQERASLLQACDAMLKLARFEEPLAQNKKV